MTPQVDNAQAGHLECSTRRIHSASPSLLIPLVISLFTHIFLVQRFRQENVQGVKTLSGTPEDDEGHPDPISEFE